MLRSYGVLGWGGMAQPAIWWHSKLYSGTAGYIVAQILVSAQGPFYWVFGSWGFGTKGFGAKALGPGLDN